MPDNRHVLSDSQRLILSHLLRGDSQKQIAAKLGRSIGTVHNHVKVLHRHFNVNTRAELLALFISPDAMQLTEPVIGEERP